MNVGIGTVAERLLSWEYLFQIFSIVTLQRGQVQDYHVVIELEVLTTVLTDSFSFKAYTAIPYAFYFPVSFIQFVQWSNTVLWPHGLVVFLGFMHKANTAFKTSRYSAVLRNVSNIDMSINRETSGSSEGKPCIHLSKDSVTTRNF